MKHIDTEKIQNYKIQPIHQGYGPTYMRTYLVKIPVPIETAQKVFNEFKNNAQTMLPDLIASVEKTKKKTAKIKNGQRYVIHLLGPWDAPVEAQRVDERFFEFVTLETAPEAGHIQYSIRRVSDTKSEFVIHSVAKSGLILFHIMYHYFGMAKYFQRKMWEQVCVNFHDRCLAVEGLPKEKVVPVFSQTVSSQGERKSKVTPKTIRA